jgi:putative tryptophan/tyrosine transport system substrate-binding protein
MTVQVGGMDRRRFLLTSLAGVLAAPTVGRAQGLRRIGYLSTRSPAEAQYVTDAFIRGLSELGYVEGRNVAIDFRWAELKYDQLPALASELVRRRVDVIAAVGGAASGLAAKAATSTIPIVFVSAGDPITFGLVTRLAQPGGNVTGVSMITVALAPKRLELLHQVVAPSAGIAMLANPTSPYIEAESKDVLGAARGLGRRVIVVNAATPVEIDAAFVTLVQQGLNAVLVSGDPFFDSQRDKLVALAARHRVAAIYQWSEFATIGGLMSYGTSITNAYREAGLYTARILKGAKPSEMPVLQPTKVETVINLKAARALDLTIPPSLLARADQVIE